MELLTSQVRRYPWGSREAIPRLLGLPPDGERQAELWLGAHETAPSTLIRDGVARSLADVVAADPAAELGPATVAGDRRRVPFLAKVLAVESPLSLQLHPSGELAATGFAREEAAGVRRDDPTRLYGDPFGKPEVGYALSQFTTFCGIRPVEHTADLLRTLPGRLLEPFGVDDLRDRIRALLTANPTAAADLVRRVHAACTVRADHPRWGPTARAVAEVAERHPTDPAVACLLLLNHLRLAPGEALAVPPGTLHCHLAGVAFEAQASSDNTLRAGLTGKQVDVDAVLAAADPEPVEATPLTPTTVGDEQVYTVPWPDFTLSRAEVAGDVARLAGVTGPQVLFCAEGRVRVRGRSSVDLPRGAAAYAGHGEGDLTVEGAGRLLRVTTGRDLARGQPSGAVR